MSMEEDDAFWNSSDVKAFNFDDEDHAAGATVSSSNSAPSESTNSGIKSLDAILAARQPSEPFLRPSLIACDGSKIERLISYLDNQTIKPRVTAKQDPKGYIREIVDKRVAIDFSPYKSKREKLLLLDSAICCSDGNVITAATIFISQTLKQSIFIDELKRRPIAVDHYINYLEMTGKTREALELTKKLLQ